ncbi:pre-mRNA-splicing factor RBM22/SLT11 [Acrasis kona]|uniref:Pre-mRNA-splicing factor RBM22/SLT11 n=1 Tax=Acrasis kona TaxID=1008807 RepID=A0AAW2YXM3_9EUKA
MSLAVQNENNEFPVLCSNCLGSNPFVRMTKRTLGEECRFCSRVYTGFTWKKEKSARHNKTQICPVCATMKNLCQCCVLDLEFNLPSYVRDGIMPDQEQDAHNAGQKSEVARIYNAELAEKMIQEGGTNKHLLAGETAIRTETVLRLARSAPYELRNKNTVGERLKAPDDLKIRTLYVGGLEGHEEIDQKDIHQHFETFGTIQSIKMATQQGCAFVTFDHRVDAEGAADSLYNKLIIKEVPLRILWAKPKRTHSKTNQSPERIEPKAVPPPPGSEKESLDVYPILKSIL